jgi:hypothetical protein
MQIGQPRDPRIGGASEVAPVARTGAPLEVKELQLEQLTPEQVAQVRSYLAGAQETTAALRGLTPPG